MARPRSKAGDADPETVYEEIKGRLANVASGVEGVTPKNMFGYRYFFYQGHAVAGVMGTAAQFYLDEPASAEFLEMPATDRWMTDSRDPGEGWHGLKNALGRGDALLEKWMRRAVAFAATRPPELPKKSAPKRTNR